MGKILVVDDEVAIRELIREAFVSRGHQVRTVPSAAQSLDVIFKEAFDLILLDVRLSGESGISVLEKIREAHKTIPVVVYSGNITVELEKNALKAGANEVLNKSMPLLQFIERIEKIIKAGDSIFNDSFRSREKKILVVDDNAEIRNLLKDFFKARNYLVAEADCGEKALDIVKGEKISAVLLDIQMPGLDGINTLKKLREIKPELGVIMVTGIQDDDKVKEALTLGAYGYVVKPFDFLYLELVVMAKLLIAGSD